MRIGLSSALLACSVAIAANVIASGPAASAQFPSAPIHLVVGYPPGAGNDLTARIVGQYLSEYWKQPVIIENRAGASGVVGAEYVARAKPDGYTLLFTGSSHLIQAALTKGPYDAVKDFTAMGQVGTGQLILEVNPSLKANSVAELIALAKSEPGKLTFGSAGTGTSPHIAGEMFDKMAGVKMQHIPYKGSAPAQTDLIGGQIDMMFQVTQSALPSIAAHQVRALGVSGTKRMAELPNVPTIAEAGVSGFDLLIWWGVLGPKGVPPETVAAINDGLKAVLANPEARKRIHSVGLDPEGSTSDELSRTMATDFNRYSKLIAEAGIKGE